jgi:hypothetical protein
MNRYHSLAITLLFSTAIAASDDTKKLPSYRVAAALSAIQLPSSVISIILEYGQWFFVKDKPTIHHYPRLDDRVSSTFLTVNPDELQIDRFCTKEKKVLRYNKKDGDSFISKYYAPEYTYYQTTDYLGISTLTTIRNDPKTTCFSPTIQDKMHLRDTKLDEFRQIVGQQIIPNEDTEEVAAVVSLDQKKLFVTLPPLEQTITRGQLWWRDVTETHEKYANNDLPRIAVYSITFEPPLVPSAPQKPRNRVKTAKTTSLVDMASYCSIS